MIRFTRHAILTGAFLLMSSLAVAQGDPDVAEGWQKIVPDPVTTPSPGILLHRAG
jgi:hypothetical protein